jgi:cell division protein ZapA
MEPKENRVTQPNGSIRVDIFDQAYHLRGTDGDYIEKLAEYVDSKMRTIASQSTTVDSLRIAVLAALNIADEYQTLKAKYESVNGEYSQRATHLKSALDSALDEVLQDVRRAG